MDTSKYLILNKRKNYADITEKVQTCKPETGNYRIVFNGGQNSYSYTQNSIEFLQDPEILKDPNEDMPSDIRISVGGRILADITAIFVFHSEESEWWRIRFFSGKERLYARNQIDIRTSCLTAEVAGNCFSYLKELSANSNLKSDDGKVLLKAHYDAIKFIDKCTALAVYLNPEKQKARTQDKENIIFPFGGNASQFKAVENALRHQISVVQGPPGTGKTQTILNIVANLIADNKKIVIVSNNNSATLNVLEKLASPKYDLNFLVAPLGRSENKKAFIKNQTELYPDFLKWRMETGAQATLKEAINLQSEALKTTFGEQERLAQAKLELSALLLEMEYFKDYCKEDEPICLETVSCKNLTAQKFMDLWQECCRFSERARPVSLWYKIKSAFVYGIANWEFYKNSSSTVITLLQKQFYNARKMELTEEISTLEDKLSSVDAEGMMHELTKNSLSSLHANLCEYYANKQVRAKFEEDDLWKRPGAVVKEYPIVLSTTFSACTSLQGIMYDYLIMDEASQVDIATGALALSCAKNVVIVGDLQQLSNVVKEEQAVISNKIFEKYQLAHGYSFSENSFLKSICTILPNVPQALLKEHYRCHPKIIGFCNQKFYNNELIVMTENCKEPNTLVVIKTAVGNHQRGRTSDRQVDVISQDILPKLMEAKYKPEDIGIIAPYGDQVAAVKAQLPSDSKIEVDTVHKFQGREKDVIVLSTVADKILATDFAARADILNVAVSRAKKMLWLVVSGNEQPADSNIADLVAYVEYNNFEVVQSEIRSVFDLLYQQYTDERISFLKKHPRVSRYDSENLMYAAIVELLTEFPQLSLGVICHQPLSMLIRNTDRLTEEDRLYVKHPATHVDFLIYNKVSKKPVLAIEVDGFQYHKKGSPQGKRDERKNRILGEYKIPLVRLLTNGSDEIERIRESLQKYARIQSEMGSQSKEDP